MLTTSLALQSVPNGSYRQYKRPLVSSLEQTTAIQSEAIVITGPLVPHANADTFLQSSLRIMHARSGYALGNCHTIQVAQGDGCPKLIQCGISDNDSMAYNTMANLC